MGGGRIDAVMTCTEQGAAQTMTLAGTYSPDSYAMQMRMEAADGGDTPGMRMNMRVDAKRVGECPASAG